MKILKHNELVVYQMAFDSAMKIFEISKGFPKEEAYSLTDQFRRSSRSVCANIAEAFRKRIYPKSFISKLNDSEAEAAETQVWLDFAFRCNLISKEFHDTQYSQYECIIGKLINMYKHPEDWLPCPSSPVPRLQSLVSSL